MKIIVIVILTSQMSPFQILHIIKQQAQYENYQNYCYFDVTKKILDENAIS